ncbi:MAG: ribosomal protein S18-alanine N-acetyltransferase [Candidatus Cloacimonadota bacterium]|nr:ribosomal protein S18-alanine N-acetyltransferase [Candidatus Cloacimonadota bacterium]
MIEQELLKIELIEQDDIQEIMRIENSLFAVPWSEETFTIDDKEQPSYKLLMNDILIGYLCGIIIQNVFYISNIAIDKKYQRKGYASYFLNKIIDKKIAQNFKKFILEVRENNKKALKLYKKLHFRIYQRKKNYYFNPVEDALVLGRIIDYEKS